ncbi:competence protein ComEA [Paenibacillus sp. UNCCL117]|nr:competence protein ComEA [Paenibacillus sp. cl123]SFW23717.1 competence protein ComEA [Paenibacillus sp. UNCCL117]
MHRSVGTSGLWWIVTGAAAVLVIALALRFVLAAGPEAGFVAVDDAMRQLLQEQGEERGTAPDAAKTSSKERQPGGGRTSGEPAKPEAGDGAAASSAGGKAGVSEPSPDGAADGMPEANGSLPVSAGAGITGSGPAAAAGTGAGSGAGNEEAAAAGGVPAGKPAAAGSASAASDGKLDLNRATAEQLDALPGIGPSRAQAIIELRKKLGGFRSVTQLKEVKGIGAQTFKKLEPLVTVVP